MVKNDKLADARNIGPTILRRLNEVGIYSLADLAAVSPAVTYRLIKKEHSEKTIPVCYYLYSLKGALMDLHWDDIPEDMMRELKNQANG